MSAILKTESKEPKEIKESKETFTSNFDAFLAAMKASDISRMEEIYKKDKSIFKQRDEDGFSLFILAMKWNSMKAMEFIYEKEPTSLKKYVEIDQPVWTYLASKTADYSFIQNMFKPEPLSEFEDRTPFMFAAGYGNIAAMKFILSKDRGAFKIKTSREGNTPFIYAAAGWTDNPIPALEFLLKLNPKFLNQTNKNNESPLGTAAHKEKSQIVKFLLSKGAKISSKEILAPKRPEDIQYILQAHTMFDHVKKGNLKEIIAWAEKGETLKFRDGAGNSLLHLALQHGQEEVAIYLMREQDLLKYLNDDGKNPFQSAIDKLLTSGPWKEKGRDPFSILKEKMQRLSSLNIDKNPNEGLDLKEQSEKLKKLEAVFYSLIEYAKKHQYKLNPDDMIFQPTKEHWCRFAKRVIELQKTSEIENDLFVKKNLLSTLVYKGNILCQLNGRGEIEIKPSESTETSDASKKLQEQESKEKKEAIESKIESETETETGTETGTETEIEYTTRLICVFKFALEAENYIFALEAAAELIEKFPDLQISYDSSQNLLKLKIKEKVISLIFNKELYKIVTDELPFLKNNNFAISQKAWKNCIPIMKFLFQLNPNVLDKPNKDGVTPIHIAARHGDLDSIKFLLSMGAKINCKSYHTNKSEIDYAKEYGHDEIADYIAQTIEAFHYVSKGKLNEIREWVIQGNSLNFRMEDGKNLLHIALLYGQEEVALYLMEQNVSRSCIADESAEKDKNPFQCAIDHMKHRSDKNKTVKMIPILLDMVRETKEEVCHYHPLPCQPCDPFHVFQEFMQRVAEKCSDEKERDEALKPLFIEYDSLIQYAEKQGHKVDYEELALKIDKKYWCHFAKKAAELKRTADSTDDFCAKKEKLSHLIYSQMVLCRLSDQNELIFEQAPKIEAEMKAMIETEQERHTRLTYALKFALEAEDFATAMRLAVEMTTETATLPVMSEVSQKASKFKSKDELFLSFVQFNYKQKAQHQKKEASPKSFKASALSPLSLDE